MRLHDSQGVTRHDVIDLILRMTDIETYGKHLKDESLPIGLVVASVVIQILRMKFH